MSKPIYVIECEEVLEDGGKGFMFRAIRETLKEARLFVQEMQEEDYQVRAECNYTIKKYIEA